MVEPLTTASVALEAYPIAQAVGKTLAAKSEIADLFDEVAKVVKADSRLVYSARAPVSKFAKGLPVQWQLMGAVSAFLGAGDDKALDTIETDLVKLLVDLASRESLADLDPRIAAGVILEAIRENAHLAKSSDLQAAHFEHERTRRGIEAQGDALAQHGDALARQEEMLKQLLQGSSAGTETRVLVVTDATPESVSLALKKLGGEAPGEIALVEHLIEAPDAAEQATEMITSPSAELKAASASAWLVLARVAELGARWPEAATAWEEVSARSGGSARALVNASIAASLAGEDRRTEDLLLAAEAIDPSHPKLLLERSRAVADPSARLAFLEGLDSEDDQEGALIECHRAICSMQLGDLPAGQAAARRARERAPKLLQVRLISANVLVQAGRVDPVRADVHALREAETDLLAVRDELRERGRWGESASALMLAIDAAALCNDRPRAHELVRSWTKEEAAADGGLAIADAALRIQCFEIAIELASLHEGDTARRIVASAQLATDAANEEARASLEALVQTDGDESVSAALSLLISSAFDGAPWSDEAAAKLESDYSQMVLELRAMSLTAAGDFPAARQLLETRITEPGVLAHLFFLSIESNDESRFDLVNRVLASNPSRGMRLQAAGVLLEKGDTDRAEAEVRLIAGDQAANDGLRESAYRVLVDVLGKQERWDEALLALEDWQRDLPSSDLPKQLLPGIGNRLAASRPARD